MGESECTALLAKKLNVYFKADASTHAIVDRMITFDRAAQFANFPRTHWLAGGAEGADQRHQAG